MSERKALSLSLPDDAAPGAVQAVFSTFDVLDKGRDVVKRSAFADLDGAEVPLIWAHDWASMAVGKGTIRVQPRQAVFDGTFHLQTEHSREAYATVKAMGALQEYSYGFEIAPDGWKFDEADDGPVRLITKIARVFEVSPVLVGMGEGTRTLAIKGLLDELTDSKAGRRLSAASLARIQAAIEALGALLEADAATPDDGDKAAPPTEPLPTPPPPPMPTTPSEPVALAPLAATVVVAVRSLVTQAERSSHDDVCGATDALKDLVSRLADAQRLLEARLRHAKAGDGLDPAELFREFAALDRGLAPILAGGR